MIAFEAINSAHNDCNRCGWLSAQTLGMYLLDQARERGGVASDRLTVAFLAESPVPYDAFPGVQSALRRKAG